MGVEEALAFENDQLQQLDLPPPVSRRIFKQPPREIVSAASKIIAICLICMCVRIPTGFLA